MTNKSLMSDCRSEILQMLFHCPGDRVRPPEGLSLCGCVFPVGCNVFDTSAIRRFVSGAGSGRSVVRKGFGKGDNSLRETSAAAFFSRRAPSPSSFRRDTGAKGAGKSLGTKGKGIAGRRGDKK